MTQQDSAKARADKIFAWLGAAASLGAMHPATRIPAAALGTMLTLQQFHSAYDTGGSVQNQPDDFGNYYGPGGEKLDTETGRRVEEMTNRVINAGWY